MEFHRLKLVTEAPTAVEADTAAKATAGGEKQVQGTIQRKQVQNSELGTSKFGLRKQNPEVDKNVVGEGHLKQVRSEKEVIRMNESLKSNWRKDLNEVVGDMAPEDEEDNHPYVEVMPSTDFKQREAAAQLKGAAKAKQQSMAAGLKPQMMGEGFKEDERALEKQRHAAREKMKAKLKAKRGPSVTPKKAGIKAGSEVLKPSKPPVNWNPGAAD